jgi:ribosomal protein S27E
LESALECCEKVHADDLESVFFSAHCVDCENEMCEGPSVPA